jgi:hypothetical protein
MLAFHPLQLICSSKNSHSIAESRSSDIMIGSCSRVCLSCFDHSSRPRSGIFVFASYSSTTIHGNKSYDYAIKSIWGESPSHVKEASKTKDYAATGRLLVAVGRHVTVRSQGLHGSVDGKCRSLVAVDGIPAVSNGGK